MDFTENQITVVAERWGCSREQAEDALQYAFGNCNFYSYLKDWIDNQRVLLLENVCGKYRKRVSNFPLMALMRLRDEQRISNEQGQVSRHPAYIPEVVRPYDPHNTGKKTNGA